MEGERRPGNSPALVVCVVATILVLSGIGYGQLSNSTLVGTVQDPGGAVLPGSTVTVRNMGTNQTRTDITSAEGLYRIVDLPPGIYEVRAEKAGFKTTLTSNVVLHVGETSRVDLVMQVGMVEQKVEVTAGVVMVNTEEGGTTDIVEQEQVEELPLVHRNIYQLPVLEPGTQPARILIPTYYSNAVYDLGFVTYGKNIRATNFMLDGAPNNDNGLGGLPALAPILDAVQEFQVSTNDFGREFGRNFGAVINVATKSGTNAIHGSGWEFHRNAAVNASNFFDPGKPSVLIQNQFGGTLGGPIRKDKTFWFIAYEGFRERRGVTRRVQVETPQLRDWVAANLPGTVSDYLFRNFPGPNTNPTTEVSLGIQPINDPRCPSFPQSQCPDLGIGTGQRVNSTTNDQYDLRFDELFHQGSDRLFVRWVGFYPRTSGVGELTTIGGLGRIIRGFARPADGSIGNLSVGETHIFGHELVNDFRFGYMRNHSVISALPSNAPNFFLDDLTLGFGADSFIPLNLTNNGFNFKDNVLLTRGRHGIKLGAEYNHDLESGLFDSISRGAYVFCNLACFVNNNPVAYEALIDPNTGQDITNDQRTFRRRDFAWFFQDDWKVLKNLTLNLGLRWEYFGVLQETSGKQAGMILGSGNTIQEQLVNATFAKVGELYKPNYRNFAPLLGMAWDPMGNGKFSLRAAWAINYDRIHNDLLSEPARFTPPFAGFGLGFGVPGCPLPTYTVASVFTFPQVLPAGFGGGLNPSNNYLGCGFGGLLLIDRNIKTPYVEQWNLSLQYELVNNWVLELSYAGNQGHRLSFTNDPNRVTGGLGGIPANRPNNALGGLDYLTTSGASNYNGASVQVKKRFTHGYLLQASYTFGKAMDVQDDANAGDFIGSGTGYNGTEDASKRRLDYGRSSFDIRHRVAVNGVWEIGKFSKQGPLVRNLLGGWQINTIFSYESGRPFSVFNTVVDYNGDGGGAAQAPPTGNAFDRPNTSPIFGNALGCRSPHAYANGLFQAYANQPNTQPFGFPVPAPGTDGNLGRNTFCGPNYKEVDFSLVRNFSAPFMGERGKIQFRVEAFNLFNRVNLYLPDSDLGTVGLRAGLSSAFSTFGKSAQAYTPRELQFGLKLTW